MEDKKETKANDKRTTYKMEHQIVENTPERNQELKEMTQRYFDQFDSNTISIFCAKHNKQYERVVELKTKEEALMNEIFNSEVSDIFCDLLIAEYKEMYYESIYFPHFEHGEMLHMEEYERIILEYYGENTLWEHEHDPTHFMYDDGNHHYMFYDMIEKRGFYILDEQDRELADEERFCDIYQN